MGIKKNIAAFTKHHNEQPGFVSINQIDDGEVEICVRADGNMDEYASIKLSGDEFKQLVGEIILTGVR